MFAMRLLELEQKFESYKTIHQEELREIKALLDQLREELLNSGRDESIDFLQKRPLDDSPLISPNTSERKE